jgi:hypothetical protein
MKELVVIEDSTIASMARDSTFTSAIPCLFNQLAAIQPPATSCGSCARRKAEGQRAALANIKTCLAGMSQEKKNELKALLDTKQVKIVFATATGQISYTTF